MSVGDLATMLVLTLTAIRVTTLITRDAIAEPYTDRISGWLEARWMTKHRTPGTPGWEEAEESPAWNSRVAYMLNCDSCLGVWVSGVLVAALWYPMHLTHPWLAWAVASAGVSLVSQHFDSRRG